MKLPSKVQLAMLVLALHSRYEEYREKVIDWSCKKLGIKRKPKLNLDTFRTEEGAREYFKWLSNNWFKKGSLR